MVQKDTTMNSMMLWIHWSNKQGHVLEPKILKGIYLWNIKDNLYEKDSGANTDTITLPEIQAQIFQKYLAIQGERRTGTPSYTQKGFVNTAYSKQVNK